MKKLILGIALLGILGSNQAYAMNDGIQNRIVRFWSNDAKSMPTLALISAAAAGLLTRYTNIPIHNKAVMGTALIQYGLGLSLGKYLTGLQLYNNTAKAILATPEEDTHIMPKTAQNTMKPAYQNLKALESNFIFYHCHKDKVIALRKNVENHEKKVTSANFIHSAVQATKHALSTLR